MDKLVLTSAEVLAALAASVLVASGLWRRYLKSQADRLLLGDATSVLEVIRTWVVLATPRSGADQRCRAPLDEMAATARLIQGLRCDGLSAARRRAVAVSAAVARHCVLALADDLPPRPTDIRELLVLLDQQIAGLRTA